MLFAVYYVKWHYTQAVVDLIGIVKNFLWFFWEFFSIKLLLKSLFTPFHRLGQQYKGGLDLSNLAETILVNTLMRFVGFLLRSFLILLGILCILLTFVVGIFFLVAWVLAPLLLVFLIAFGVKMITIP